VAPTIFFYFNGEKKAIQLTTGRSVPVLPCYLCIGLLSLLESFHVKKEENHVVLTRT
jgi:hypothetical protein